MESHVHPLSPKSTAKQGTTRLRADVQALVPPPTALGRWPSIAADVERHASAYAVLMRHGSAVRVQLQDLPEVLQGSGLTPVRRIGSRRKAKHRPGMVVAQVDGMGMHLPYESRLEGAHLLQLLYRQDAPRLMTQPMVLVWPDGDRALRYIPDILACTQGETRVIEVKPAKRMSERYELLFALTSMTLASVGVGFGLLGSLKPQRMLNLEALAMHRHANPHLTLRCEAARTERAATFGGVIDSAGGGHSGLAAGLHLLTTGVTVDLDRAVTEASRVTWPASRVHVPPRGAS